MRGCASPPRTSPPAPAFSRDFDPPAHTKPTHSCAQEGQSRERGSGRDGAAAGAVGGDVHPVPATGLAEAAGPVLRQVDEDVLAVFGGADSQPVQLVGPDDVDE